MVHLLTFTLDSTHRVVLLISRTPPRKLARASARPCDAHGRFLPQTSSTSLPGSSVSPLLSPGASPIIPATRPLSPYEPTMSDDGAAPPAPDNALLEARVVGLEMNVNEILTLLRTAAGQRTQTPPVPPVEPLAPGAPPNPTTGQQQGPPWPPPLSPLSPPSNDSIHRCITIYP